MACLLQLILLKYKMKKLSLKNKFKSDVEVTWKEARIRASVVVELIIGCTSREISHHSGYLPRNEHRDILDSNKEKDYQTWLEKNMFH